MTEWLYEENGATVTDIGNSELIKPADGTEAESMLEASGTFSDGTFWTLWTWDPHKRHDEYHDAIYYELWHDGRLVFSGDDFGNSPQHAIDSLDTVEALLSFLSLRDGDTDREYFDHYTPEQLAFAENYGEELGMVASDITEHLEGQR